MTQTIDTTPCLDLSRIDAAITQGVTTDASIERLAEVIDMVAAASERLKEVKAHLDAALFDHVQANGEITVGTIRYFIGTEKKTRCRDVKETLRTLLELRGLDEVTKCLGASAFKYGEVRKQLEENGCPDEFDRLFEVTEEEELKEGKPVKVKALRKSDTRFER